MKAFSDFGIDIPPGARGDVHVRCPFCPTRKPSHRNERDLSVNVEEGTWFCHHCSAKGGLGSRMDSYGAKLKQYERPAPLKINLSGTAKMLDWFWGRGISKNVVAKNMVQAVTRNGEEAIAFPYFWHGEHINTTYRTYDKRFSQEKDAERILYGLDLIESAGENNPVPQIVLCEGQVDKLSFDQAGISNALSIPDGAVAPGATVTDGKMRYLEHAASVITRARIVYLACDNDAPGQAMNEELARRIGRSKCRIVRWPSYIKDANEALVKVGPELIAECIEQAQPYPVEGVVSPDDLYEPLRNLYERGMDPGLRLGWKLDEYYRVRPGLLTILTGHSSHGKSLWLDHVMMRLAEKHDWHMGIFSPENQPLERHLANLIEIHTHKNFNRTKGNSLTWPEIESVLPFVTSHFSFVLPETATIDVILDRADSLLLHKGLNMLVIDPWNELVHAYRGLSETLYVSEELRKVREWGRRNSVAVTLAAHPTKHRDNVEEAPTLNDISGSVNFRNKADFGISIFRQLDKPSQCIVQKVRFSETGRPGTVEFRYTPDKRVEDVSW